MDTLKGITEAVEAEFGEAIITRDESLVPLCDMSGLGPPDLCWLQKRVKSAWGSQKEPKGYYHYVTGTDVSSSAALSAYFAEVMSSQESISFLQGLWTSNETQIDRGFYCTYDPFSRLDIRCELCVPGGVVCGALDPEGTVHDVTRLMWRNCQLAGFLRAELYDAELTSHCQNLSRYDPLATAGDETRMLELILEMYADKTLPAGQDAILQDQACGCTAEHMDIVLFTVQHHFGRRQRWEAALRFFTQVLEVHPGAAVYLSAAQRELDMFDESFNTLSDAVERDPYDPQLLVALATECLYADKADMAAKLARRAIHIRPATRPAWLMLSRCYIRQNLFKLSLVALNVVPAPPLPGQELELLFTVAPPKPKLYTQPHWTQYDAEATANKHMTVEEVSLDGSKVLMYLPGAVMVNREPLDIGPWSDLGPYRLTRAVLSSAYGMLQELMAAIGWDNFLDIRTRVFVMHNEPGAAAATAAAAAAMQEQAVLNSRRHHSIVRDEVPEFEDSFLQEMKSLHIGGGPRGVTPTRVQGGEAAPPPREPPQGPEGMPGAITAASMHRTVAESEDEASTTVSVSAIAQQGEDTEVEGSVLNADDDELYGRHKDSEYCDEDGSDAWGGASSASRTASRLVDAPSMQEESVQSAEDRSGYGVDVEEEEDVAVDRGGSATKPVCEEALGVTESSPPSENEPSGTTKDETSGTTNDGTSGTTEDETSGPKPVAEAVELCSSHQLGLTQYPAGYTQAPGWAPRGREEDPTAVQRKKRAVQKLGGWVLKTIAPQRRQPSATPLAQAQSRTSQPCQPSATPTPQASTASGRACAVGPEHSTSHRYHPKAPSFLAPLSTLTSTAATTATPATASAADVTTPSSKPALSTTSTPAATTGLGASASTATTLPGAVGEAFDGGPSSSEGPMVSPTGGLLAAYDVDRDTALAGSATDEAVKRLCVRWLDELIIALWHDLQAYMDWKAQDTDLAKTPTANSVAGILLGLPASEACIPGGVPEQMLQVDTSGLPLPPLPDLSQGDWMRRGLLAERLYHDADALLAYRCCVRNEFNMLAWVATMRLASQASQAPLTLLAVHEVMTWHDNHIKQTPGTEKRRLPRCPIMVVCCVCVLVAQLGIEGVSAAHLDLGLGDMHPAVRQLLDSLRKVQVSPSTVAVSGPPPSSGLVSFPTSMTPPNQTP